MQKILITALLLTFCCSSILASAADKEEKAESMQKKRGIIEQIVTKPLCKPKEPQMPPTQAEKTSDLIRATYAPVLPEIAPSAASSGCTYTVRKKDKQTTAGLFYSQASIICLYCNYNPTIFHIPLKASMKECTKPLTKRIYDSFELKQQAENLGFDTKDNGIFMECPTCQNTALITTEDPSTLILKKATEAENDDEEFYV